MPRFLFSIALVVFASGASAEVGVVLMGGPGSGKGTLGLALARRLGLVHVSAGDLLRAEVARGTPLGLAARDSMAKGDLLPDTAEAVAPLFGLVAETLRSHPGGFVLEGLTRNLFRAVELERVLARLGRRLTAAVVIDVPRETIFSRLDERLTCPQCQRTYNLGRFAPTVPGICDDCRTPLARRADDTIEVIARRLEVYERNLGAVLAFYEERGALVRIDGERLDPEAIEALAVRLEECANLLNP